MYSDDEYLPLSGIQHFIFCRRQWALIDIENQWKENLRTTEGHLMHERAHNENILESRRDTVIMRGLRIGSAKLGISGVCDVVEFHRADSGVPLKGYSGYWSVYPVEYKRGAPKTNLCDHAQLCAEAMCLEEMLGTEIPEGALFYGETRRREEVVFDENLRATVVKALGEMHSMYARGHTPASKPGKWCNACSLKEICLPKLTKVRSVSAYLEDHLCENS